MVSSNPAAIAAYRKKPFANLDGLLLALLLLFGLLELAIVYIGNQIELKEMTEEEVADFFATRFSRIEQIAPEVVEEATIPDVLTSPSDLAEETVPTEAEEVLEQPVEQQQGSAQQAQSRREAAAERRAGRRAAISQELVNSTGGVALVTGSGPGAASGLTAQVTSGSAVSTEGLVGMVTGSAAENVRKLRTDGPQAGGSGGVDLQSAMTGVNSAVEGGTVGDLLEGEVQNYDRSGRFANEQARSPQVLRSVIAGYSPGLKDCFESQLQRDRSLKGSVLLQFTIAPDGTVKDVEFKRQNWSDERLGRRVESCIKQRVRGWRFDPVDSSLGDFKTGQKLTFN
jgi:outer membrane biosynthesis protein TonB